MVTRGTIAIIGRSHICSSIGTAIFLMLELKENIDRIIAKIRMLKIKLKVPARFTGITGLKMTCSKINIRGPAMR